MHILHSAFCILLYFIYIQVNLFPRYPPEPTGKMLALRRSLDADAHRPVRIFRLLLPSVWAQHGAEALVNAFDELSGAFRSQKPLTFVL